MTCIIVIYDKTNNNKCEKCEDKFCLPCDDKYYGQIGYDGNCDSSIYENALFAYCNNKCKEGLYNINGIYFNCSIGSPGCKICNITIFYHLFKVFKIYYLSKKIKK